MQKIELSNIDFSKVKKEYLMASCILLIIAVAFFAYQGIFGPILDKTRVVTLQIKQKKRAIQRAEITPRDLRELEREIRKLKKQMDYYQRSLTGRTEIPQMLKELNKIAEGLNIKFISVIPLEKKKITLPGGKDVLVELPIRINLQSGYHQLGIFINQIENPPNFMKIRELQISADPRSDWVQRSELLITSYRIISK